jgi:fermentation-respiration switch protein FrsA (DUF1100 family)
MRIAIKTAIGTAITLCLLTASLAAQVSSFEGVWSGTLATGGQKLRIVLNVKRDKGNLSATMDSPDQGALGLPLDSVSIVENRVHFSSKAMGISYEGVLTADHIKGTFAQRDAKIPLAFDRGALKAARRPQYPTAPLPYNSEEVTVSNGQLRLAGTFTRPKTGGPFTTILLVAGSGPQDRDETIFNQKPFLVLSDYLTRAGYAVLRLDKRGTGKSAGDFRASGLEEFTSDAIAAVAWLKARPDVNARRIGVLGHSEGGVVAPLVAVRSSDVAFVIMLGGPAEPFDKLLTEQSTAFLRAQGAPDAVIEADQQIRREEFVILGREPDEARARERLQQLFSEWNSKQPELTALLIAGVGNLLTPEVRSLLAHSPSVPLRDLRCPILAVYGGKDLQVPAASNLPAAAAALTDGHAESFTLVNLSGLNHLFQTARTGNLEEYAQSEETISPRALDTIAAWLRTNVK